MRIPALGRRSAGWAVAQLALGVAIIVATTQARDGQPLQRLHASSRAARSGWGLGVARRRRGRTRPDCPIRPRIVGVWRVQRCASVRAIGPVWNHGTTRIRFWHARYASDRGAPDADPFPRFRCRCERCCLRCWPEDDIERARRIGELWQDEGSRPVAEPLIDLVAEPDARALIFGGLRELENWL